MALTGLSSTTTTPKKQTVGLQNPTSVGSTAPTDGNYGSPVSPEDELKKRQLYGQGGQTYNQSSAYDKPLGQGGQAPTSPVSSTGQITPTAQTGQAQPQQQVQAQQPQPQPQQATPQPAAGWIQIAGGGWVPPGHPLAAQAGQQAGSQSAVSSQTQQSSTTPLGVPQNAIYTPGTLPQLQPQTPLPTTDLPTYQGYNVSQFQTPDQQQSQNLTNNLLQRVLSNPESMSPEVVAQLKEQQKESALSMQDQLMQQFQQSNASRGFAQGGNLDLNRRRVADDTIGNILEGQRGIDIAASQTNMADRLNALGAAEQSMTGQMGRSTSGYQSQLAGQQAQAGQDYQQYGSQADATKFALDRALQQEQLNQGWDSQNMQRAAAEEANRQAAAQSAMQAHQLGSENQLSTQQLALQQSLGQQGLNLEGQRLGENTRQFDQGYNLDMLNFLNNATMGRYNLGTDYAKLQQQMMQYLGGS